MQAPPKTATKANSTQRAPSAAAPAAARREPALPASRNVPAAASRASAAEKVQFPASSVVMKSRTRAKNLQTKQDMNEIIKMEQKQIGLRAQKLEELRERFAGGAGVGMSSSSRAAKKLADCQAYRSPDDLPVGMRPFNRVRLDMQSEALLVPMVGAIVPFHAKIIKNMSRNKVDNTEYLRVNFFTPGQGKSADDFPVVSGNRVYVRELSFRSDSAENFEYIVRNFKEVQKRLKQKELEGDVAKGSGTSTAGLTLQTLRQFQCLRDLHMRPSVGQGSRRNVGQLEAHANGFRFSSKGGKEKIDIFYSQVRHAIFEPCETQSLIVVIHLHLHEPMLIGKKKTQDVQFFTEVTEQQEDLTKMKAGSAHDPDEILQEQREREMKERLNKIFKDFCAKVQNIESCPLEFDIPFLKDFSFQGVPYKGQVALCPCAHALVGLQEWPPFCLSIEDIDIVVFERAMNLQLREFDMVFVKKNYNESPIRITTIPRQHFDMIRCWLMTIPIVWYSCTMNMQWQPVMKEVTKDLQDFVERGGWDAWFGADDDGSSAEDNCKESGSDWNESGADDASGGDDEDSDFDAADDDVEEDSEPASEDDDGLDFDELEEQAARADKKRDAAAREGGREMPTRASKRARK